MKGQPEFIRPEDRERPSETTEGVTRLRKRPPAQRENWTKDFRDNDLRPDNESLENDFETYCCEYLGIKSGRLKNLKILTRYVMALGEDWMMLCEGLNIARGKEEAMYVGFLIGEMTSKQRATKLNLDWHDLETMDFD